MANLSFGFSFLALIGAAGSGSLSLPVLGSIVAPVGGLTATPGLCHVEVPSTEWNQYGCPVGAKCCVQCGGKGMSADLTHGMA